MKIIPVGTKLHLKIDKAEAGALNLESMNTAVEFAEVLDVGEEVKDYKKGDKVFVKAWSIDIVSYGEERFYFVDIKSGGVCAKVE